LRCGSGENIQNQIGFSQEDPRIEALSGPPLGGFVAVWKMGFRSGIGLTQHDPRANSG
jgi:hypothetical protein